MEGVRLSNAGDKVNYARATDLMAASAYQLLDGKKVSILPILHIYFAMAELCSFFFSLKKC